MIGTVVPVSAAGPLTITNVDSPDPVQSGSQILYSVTVTNTGGAKVDNVHLTDQINGVVGIGNPLLLDVVSSRGSCTQTNTQVSCDALSIEGNGVWTVSIRGVVTAAGGTTINNIATVVATKSAQTYTTSAAATTQVLGSGPGGPSPDLTIGKTGPLSVTPNNTITYTLTVNNLGNGNALGVKVTDTLPAAVTITGVSQTSLFTCTTSGQTVTCINGRVNAGANATITVNGTVGATAAGDLENTSVVDPDNTIDEGILGNTADAAELNNFSNTVVTHVSPVPPPVTDAILFDKTGPLSAKPNDLIRYTLLTTNGKLGRADYVTVTDGTQGLQAASLHVISAVATSGTKPVCTVAAPTVTCTMTRLSASTTSTPQTMTVIIEGMVVASAGSTIINSAAVNANIKNTGYTARDEVQTIINAGRDLTISKVGTPDPVCARSWPDGPNTTNCRGGLRYTFVVGNSGVQVANNVVVRDPLPADTIFDAAASDPRCGVASGIVTCTIASLAGGATDTIVIVVVAPATLGTITNTVTVDPSNAIFESDETNNIAVATTTVATGINLTINKTDASPGFDPIATSGTQTYTITVDNPGTQDASGIRVRDTLPAGTTFLSVTADNGFTCSYSAGIVECIGGAIHGTFWETYLPGNSPDDATIIIKLFAMPNVGTMHNVVRVDPLNEIAEYNENDNIAFQDTVVGTGNAGAGAFNQLTIVKTQTSPAGAVATNGTLIYNLHVSNLGTDPVSAIVVKDFLPTGSRFISAMDTDPGPTGLSDAFFCSHDGAPTGGTVTCVGGDLSGSINTIPEDDGSGNVPISRDILVTIFAPNVPGPAVNLAKVDPDNLIPEGNEFDNASQITSTVTVGGANMFNELTVSKTQTDPSGGTVATSSVVTYTIIVTNSGTDPAFNVKMTDTLPAGFTFVSAADTALPSDPLRFVCIPGAGNTINCTGATLSGTTNVVVGEPTLRTILVKAFSSAVPGPYFNTAVVDPDNTIPEGNETNNAAFAQTTVIVGGGFIDLQVTKTASPSVLPGSHVTPGGLITYTIVASNAGTNPAFNVTVRDTLPAGTTFVSAVDTTPPIGPDPNDFTCTNAAGVVNCVGATLDGLLGLAGVPTARTITIFVRAPNENILGLTNVVRIDPDNAIGESSEINNGASAVTDVQSDVNLTITKTGPKSAHQNDSTQYVLVVTNEGLAAAHGVLVTDPLPVGLIPLGSIEATPGNFACQVLENPVNVVSCVGDLNGTGDPNGFDKVTITIPVFITASGGTLDNQACVDPNNTIVESSEDDNCSTNVVPVTAKAPDLLINKSVDKASVTSGDQVTYTLTISNNGDADADGPVTVTDTLPAQADFVSSNPDAAFTCAAPVGTTLTCTASAGLTVGQSAQITVIMTVKSPLPSGTTSIENDATVSAGTCSAPCENEAAKPNRLLDNAASVTSTVGGSAIDLVMVNGSTFDAPDPVVVGQKLTYTIVVANAGSASTLTDPSPNSVVVRATLPAGLDLASAAASGGFVCIPSGPSAGPVGNVDCIGDLAAGASVIVTLTTKVTATAGTSLTVVATADPNNDIVESNEGNNSKTAITSVVAAPCTSCIDLVAGSIVATPPTPILNNTDVTYNFIVTNVGDRPTSADAPPNAVVVTIDLDTIFNESTPVSASAPGFTCVTTSPPVLVTDPEIVCTSTTGIAAGGGALFSIVAHANTGSPAPANFVDFDVKVDPGNQIAEFNEANNAASLTVFTHP